MAHPPTCPRPSCNGRTFTQQKGLRAHMRLHEQREVEAELEASIVDAGSDGDDGDHGISSIAIPPRKRRRGGEVGRDWKCTEGGCDKDFKSVRFNRLFFPPASLKKKRCPHICLQKKALATHHNVAHLHRRDFVCPHPGCGRAFGYKHLLQRHTARLHTEGLDPDDTTPEMSPAEDDAEEPELETQRLEMSAIDFLTGRAYASRIRSSKALCCPYPSLQGLQGAFIPPPVPGVEPCPFVFSRAYDLRRHLRAEHGLEVSKDIADAWVKGWREKQHNL
jgi:general transcription factor IIIA